MKIDKTECSYQVTECDLKFGEQITLNGELLIPVSVLDKIRAEMLEKSFEVPYKNQAFEYGVRLVELEEVRRILNKYKAESEDKK